MMGMLMSMRTKSNDFLTVVLPGGGFKGGVVTMAGAMDVGVETGMSSRDKGVVYNLRSTGADFGEKEAAEREVADSEKDVVDGAGEDESELGEPSGIGGGDVMITEASL